MRTIVLQPIHDVVASLEQLATAKRPFGALAITFVALVATWFIYVPIHELLHVLGCVLPGGTVTQLEIQPQYGGHLLARYFDFVVTGGEYAGRLSGFDTHGSDLIYLSTVFLPFVPSIIFGVPLLKSCASKRRPVRFGIATVLGMAPLYNIFGDYFEMASIMMTRALTIVMRPEGIAFAELRSDDVFLLLGNLVTEPDKLNLVGWGSILTGGLLILIMFAFGIVLAMLTYAVGHWIWRPFFPGVPPKTSPQ